MRIFLLLLISSGLHVALAQEQEDDGDVLFEVYMHYQSNNRGPQLYLYDGDQLNFDLTPNIGKIGIDLVRQTAAGDYREERFTLVGQAEEPWQHTYQVIRDGLYTIWFEKDSDLGYADAHLTLRRIPAAGKSKAATSARIDSSGIYPGHEVFLTRAEVQKIQRKALDIQVDKEVSSGGTAYCEANFSLRSNQSAVVHLVADETDQRTHLIIFRRLPDSRTVLLDEFQYGIEDFGFRSLSGGDYVIQYWGRQVFDRVTDLVVEVGN